MADFRGPDEVYGALFEAVQANHVFPDSKTFVDATPRESVKRIMSRFAALERTDDAGVLKAFVDANFDVPVVEDGGAGPDASVDIRARIEELWTALSRAADRAQPGSSLIELPEPYVVPGGRFREIYYWDSYFTMLGLAESGRIGAIEDMVANFAYLIDEVGFIPNGNRTYFCTRSQPPYFVLMVELLAATQGDASIVRRYLPQLEREYAFWMRGAEHLSEDGDESDRVVRLDGALLNRHWDDSSRPRPESYAEDLALASRSDRDGAALFRDLRAACESGWDFSSRWLAADSLDSVQTTRILPVDLNCLLHRLETVLARSHLETGDEAGAAFFGGRADRRLEVLRRWFFADDEGLFVDVHLDHGGATGRPSLAAAYPLFLDVAMPEQAARTAARLRDDFLAAGGWLTTLVDSGQQWDRPNGWAPLQWVAFQGLRRFGFDELADTAARRWVDNCVAVFRDTGRLLEKYDVERLGHLAGGGEYAVQDGFGWTNGVLLALMNHLERRPPARGRG